jgi:hypothetical protein
MHLTLSIVLIQKPSLLELFTTRYISNILCVKPQGLDPIKPCAVNAPDQKRAIPLIIDK